MKPGGESFPSTSIFFGVVPEFRPDGRVERVPLKRPPLIGGSASRRRAHSAVLFFFYRGPRSFAGECGAGEIDEVDRKTKKNKMFHNRRVECFSVEGAVSQSRNVE